MLTLQVKVRTWMDGVETTELVGVSARFGESISNRAQEINALPLAVPSPATLCNMSSLLVSYSCFWHTTPWWCSKWFLADWRAVNRLNRQYDAIYQRKMVYLYIVCLNAQVARTLYQVYLRRFFLTAHGSCRLGAAWRLYFYQEGSNGTGSRC